jgi:hypothetical protein
MICARDTCNNEFEPKTHNMKYCSDECCRVATNDKLKEAYYEKKARLAGKKRICKTPKCGSILSRYNEGKICNKCIAAEESAKNRELMAMVNRVSG